MSGHLPEIFISHSHVDAPFCDALAAALRVRGFDVWYDNTHLRAGDLLSDEIQDALMARQVLIPVISEVSAQSPRTSLCPMPLPGLSRWPHSNNNDPNLSARHAVFLPIQGSASSYEMLLGLYKIMDSAKGETHYDGPYKHVVRRDVIEIECQFL